MKKLLVVGILALFLLTAVSGAMTGEVSAEEGENPIVDTIRQVLGERFLNKTGLMDNWNSGEYTGVPDWLNESFFDRDGDGIPNGYDDDNDEDGIPNWLDDYPFDYDNDGVADIHDMDDDGDGMPDGIDPATRNQSNVPETGGVYENFTERGEGANTSYLREGNITHIIQEDEGMAGIHDDGWFFMHAPFAQGFRNSTAEEMVPTGTNTAEGIVDSDDNGMITEDEIDDVILALIGGVSDEMPSYENHSAEDIEAFLETVDNHTYYEYFEDENMSVKTHPMAEGSLTILEANSSAEWEYANIFLQDDEAINVSRTYTFGGLVSNWARQGVDMDNTEFSNSSANEYIVDMVTTNSGGAPSSVRENMEFADWQMDFMYGNETINGTRADYVNIRDVETDEIVFTLPTPMAFANSDDNESNFATGWYEVYGYEGGFLFFQAHYPAEFIVNATNNNATTIVYDPIINFSPAPTDNPCHAVVPDTITGVVDENFTIDGSDSYSNSTIENYTWYLPANETQYGASITLSFASTGTYNLALMVEDENGYTDTAYSTIVVVNASEIPSIEFENKTLSSEGDMETNLTAIVEFDLSNGPGLLDIAPTDNVENNLLEQEFYLHIYDDSGTDLFEGDWNETQEYLLSDDGTYFVEIWVYLDVDGNYTGMWDFTLYDETGTYVASEDTVTVTFDVADVEEPLMDTYLMWLLIGGGVIALVVFLALLLKKRKSAQARPPSMMGPRQRGPRPGPRRPGTPPRAGRPPMPPRDNEGFF